MTAIKRTADVVWEGTIARGEGHLSGGSAALDALPVTAASRFGDPEGKTTPEELIAAAHATCFTMALGSILAGEHTPPERLSVNAVVTLEEVEGTYTITRSELEVVGRVPGSTSLRSSARRTKRSGSARFHARSPEVSRCAPAAGSKRACVPPKEVLPTIRAAELQAAADTDQIRRSRIRTSVTRYDRPASSCWTSRRADRLRSRSSL
jgi:lipoyl-dependent peroxiredoxin